MVYYFVIVSCRHIIEDYCERSMLAFAQPLTEFSTNNILDEDRLADEEFASANKDSNGDAANKDNEDTNIDGNSSSTVVDAEGESSSAKTSPNKVKMSEVQQWKKDNVVAILQAGQVVTANFKFADLLHFIGETHIQSCEVSILIFILFKCVYVDSTIMKIVCMYVYMYVYICAL